MPLKLWITKTTRAASIEAGVLVLGALAVFSGCSTAEHAQSPGNYIDEKVDAARVRHALLSDSKSAFTKVRVSASKDSIELTGQVQTAQQKQKAEQDARSVEGVKDVVNNIIVGSPAAPEAK